MDENNKEKDFYKARSWQLLVDEIKGIKADVNTALGMIRDEVKGMQERMDCIERKMYWMLGVTVGVIFIIDYIFRYLNK